MLIQRVSEYALQDGYLSLKPHYKSAMFPLRFKVLFELGFVTSFALFFYFSFSTGTFTTDDFSLLVIVIATCYSTLLMRHKCEETSLAIRSRKSN